jgi:L-alanine-DL-glutamate epimerase-like enolase superfamily enzyme
VRVENGFAYPPDRPGSGLDWNEERVAELIR